MNVLDLLSRQGNAAPVPTVARVELVYCSLEGMIEKCHYIIWMDILSSGSLWVLLLNVSSRPLENISSQPQ